MPELPAPECLLPGVYAYRAATVDKIRRDAVAADQRARMDMQKIDAKPTETRMDTGFERAHGQGVMTWQERMPEHVKRIGSAASQVAYMEREIADLRAQLARQSQDDEAGIHAIWDAAKAEAAMYVEAHCVDGEMHARHIMNAARPKVTAALPLSSEQQGEEDACGS